MTGVPINREGRERLAQLLDDKRVDLDMSWTEFAAEVGVTTQTLREARMGEEGIGDVTRRGIERVMGWKRGGVQAVIDGRHPEVVDDEYRSEPGPQAEGSVVERLLLEKLDEIRARVVALEEEVRRQRDADT